MASISLIVFTILVVNISCSMCFLRMASTGLATWYGPEDGAGKGAACGWEDDVHDPPFSAMIAAGNSNIFLNGKGCGHCFQIQCSRKPYCSGKPISVTISDQCPGACNNIAYHFDLSGHAFGMMANRGQEHSLRQLGQVDIEFKRVPCNYGATKIAFKVSQKTNRYWFATAIEYTNGDGVLSRVEVAPGGTQTFSSMDNIWGAVWKKDINDSFKGPLSFKLTSADGKTLVASNAIPANYSPGRKYSSNVNF
ncbi:putative rlpA-like protein, double-psi beta-barrel [Helianthus annuus]|uniref:Putative expansin/Lol pI n=1 Tax=Helianthus annuus TaxID=4232 RepID=A0A251RXE6_HELAN|nr:putative expansin-B14 [Helianthus annuus]KAJ0442111.1 putative rlpA-like protein, double-psi beta-barrel [Helianthus annuus]KAJ0820645.1 putative expansin/Lol pI, expansin, cellulose-binding-like domain superfamily [Helianthus annuus]KAJ0835238.1 putative rlpA-like protein, double-psi beta-barrel [Helianthus annuus]